MSECSNCSGVGATLCGMCDNEYVSDSTETVGYVFAEELESDTWYWMHNPIETDLYYPVFVRLDGKAMLDGVVREREKMKGLIFQKAIVPTKT